MDETRTITIFTDIPCMRTMQCQHCKTSRVQCSYPMALRDSDRPAGCLKARRQRATTVSACRVSRSHTLPKPPGCTSARRDLHDPLLQPLLILLNSADPAREALLEDGRGPESHGTWAALARENEVQLK